jgi:hypothetical protein
LYCVLNLRTICIVCLNFHCIICIPIPKPTAVLIRLGALVAAQKVTAQATCVQFCSDRKTLRDYKNDSLEEIQKGRTLSSTTAKEKYENQYER